MRGIDFSETHYRRFYQATPTFKLLGRSAQCVYWALRTVFDPGGFFKLHGSSAAQALAVELGWFTKKDLKFLAAGLERLLEEQWIYYVPEEDALFDPDFYESEHAAKSDRQRAKEYRQRGKKIGERIKQAGGASIDPSKILSRRSTSRAQTIPVEPIRMTRPAKKAKTTEVPQESTAAVATADGIGFKMPDRSMPKARPTASEEATGPTAPSVTKRDAGVTADQKLPSQSAFEPDHPARPPRPLAIGSQVPRQPAVQAGAKVSARVPSVTKRDGSVTKCDAPVTECCSYSYYPYPNTHKPAAAAKAAAAKAAAAPVNPYPDGADDPGEPKLAAAGSTEDQTSKEYADQVSALFAKEVGKARLFSRAEVDLIAEWYQRGIDLHVIAETLHEKAQSSLKPVWSLLYFRKPVQEAWAKDRELKACEAAHYDVPAIDFEARLERLVEKLQVVPALAAQVATLRGQAQSRPEQVEEALKAFEVSYLDVIELAEPQQDNLSRSLAWLAKVVSDEELAFQRVRIARLFKREALGIPSLSLFDPQVTGEGPSQEVPT